MYNLRKKNLRLAVIDFIKVVAVNQNGLINEDGEYFLSYKETPFNTLMLIAEIIG